MSSRSRVGVCSVIATLVACNALQAQNRRQPAPTACAGKPSADTTVYRPEALDELPKVRTGPVPHFSVGPRPGTELRVHVSFVVEKDGTVDEVTEKLVDSTGTAFDAEAVRWISTLLFWPGCMEGRAVRARVIQPVNYEQVP